MSNPSWQQLFDAHPSNFNRTDGDIHVYFAAIKDALLNFIQSAKYLVGCVAWMTDPDIIDALNRTPGLSIIVNKAAPGGALAGGLLYRLQSNRSPNLLFAGSRSDLRFYLTSQSRPVDALDRVRCIGFHAPNTSGTPLMHHKFLVACDIRDGWDILSTKSNDRYAELAPSAVWTGSYNFTSAAAQDHLENALVIDRPSIAERYLEMWEQLYIRSEPLGTSHGSLTPDHVFDENQIPERSLPDDYINDREFEV
jgi:phosphatidylserine/phosphatidylglycerophosphate/cardiolipin synthase-like enzyme